MRFSKLLLKPIAAGLAFATLTVPLAGCGSDRGLTTGGLSGKGIVGDFLVGGFYGGVMGGFFGDALHPAEELPEGSFTVELPRPNDDRIIVESVGMDALRYYAHARISTELLSRMNAKNSKPEDYVKLLRETAKLWEYAERYAEAAQNLGAELAKKETKPGYKPLAIIDRSPFGRNFFFSTAYAREGTDEDEARFPVKDPLYNSSPTWAETIVAAYNHYPAGKHIEGLAKELHVDAKEANRRLQEAVKQLNYDKVFGIPTPFSNETAGKIYDVGTRAAAATKGACQVTLYVGGVILAAPSLAAGTVPTIVKCGTMANFGTGGLDTFVEVKNDLHTVLTGDSRKDLDKLKETTGTLSAITSGFVLVTSFSNFSLFGKEAVNNTHDTLQAANLSTKGFLDQYNIGGAGVSTFFDSAIWTSERGMELYGEGKFLGFKIIKDKKTGKDIIVPLNKNDLSTELSQASDPELVALLIPREIIAQLMEETKAKKEEEASLTAEIVREDARRWDEIGKAEAKSRAELEEKIRRSRGGMLSGTVSSISLDDSPRTQSQPKAEDLPFAPSKLAGRYTIVDASHPRDFAIRVIIEALDDKTIRARRVQKWTDKKGDVFFIARINPRTGQAEPQQGRTLKFSHSEAAGAYTAVMDEPSISDRQNSGLLRMVQH